MSEFRANPLFSLACIRVAMRFILVLALEYQDTKQDGVPNVCARALLKKGILTGVQHKTVSCSHIAGVFVLQVCIVVHVHSESVPLLENFTFSYKL